MKICYYCQQGKWAHDKDCLTRFVHVTGMIRLDEDSRAKAVKNMAKERMERAGFVNVEVSSLDPNGPKKE